MKTKAEMLGALIANGLVVPENWGKLSTVRAGEITERLIGGPAEAKPETVTVVSGTSALGRLAAAVVGSAMAVSQATGTAFEQIIADVKPGMSAAYLAEKKKRDGGWKRLTGGSRGWYPMRRFAADPVPLTRQVARQNERRYGKMPIGMSRELWDRELKRLRAQAEVSA